MKLRIGKWEIRASLSVRRAAPCASRAESVGEPVSRERGAEMLREVANSIPVDDEELGRAKVVNVRPELLAVIDAYRSAKPGEIIPLPRGLEKEAMAILYPVLVNGEPRAMTVREAIVEAIEAQAAPEHPWTPWIEGFSRGVSKAVLFLRWPVFVFYLVMILGTCAEGKWSELWKPGVGLLLWAYAIGGAMKEREGR